MVALSEALKSNTTLMELNMFSEHKRNNTQMAPINNPLFSIFIKSKLTKLETHVQHH